jgi:dipeptidyl-peptidase 4
VKVDLGADPDIYIARVDWSKDGRTLYVRRLTRDQKRLDMLAVDPATGASKILFSETSKTWVNVNDDFHALKDGSLIWGSERSGFAHLYRFKDGKWTQLTHGDWTVETNGQSQHTGLVGVDEAHHRLFFTANKDDVLESQLYTIDYLHPGEPKRLTERGFWNEAAMDKSATRMLVTRSSPAQPPQVYLADATGKRIAWIEENRLDAAHPYAPYLAAHRPVTYGTIPADDGTPLHYEMITPPLEPGKRYPVFFEHYGGPHAQQVKRGWMGPMAQYWVSKGWIYFQIDNRGSANRGTAFEDAIYHAMGTVEVADQAAAARWIKTQPFVDPARLAIYGWSYGGYMTLKMLEKAPAGLYAAGISGAPVTQWELYDTAYTERYLGDPAKEPAVYKGSDAVEAAPGIKAPLLLIHGLSDDNVVFENSAALINRLQVTDTPFDMMLYVGQTHHIAGEGRQAHVQKTIERFLDAKVLGKVEPNP